jgi:hypothetical protein
VTTPGSWVALRHDCVATTVPGGEWTMLTEGTDVQVVQQLGASITVRTGRGLLLRLEAEDADAVGLATAPATEDHAPAEGPFDMQRVLDALGQVDLVWDPPWTIHRISEAARLQLGLL